jgi:hypothetical protein
MSGDKQNTSAARNRSYFASAARDGLLRAMNRNTTARQKVSMSSIGQPPIPRGGAWWADETDVLWHAEPPLGALPAEIRKGK